MVNKMDESLHYHVFLLVIVLAAPCSVAEIISKSVCLGESIQLFENITLTSFTIRVTLYKIGAGRQDPIAIFCPNASGIYAQSLGKYKSKVLLENGIIMLRNIQSSDEATYAILSDGQSEGELEQIRALAPPAKPCKPKVQQVDNFLTARIDNPACYGRPAVSVYWMENSGIASKNQTVLELKRGNETCTYYACIEGEALMCAKTSSLRDYCEHITVEPTGKDNKPTPSSDTPQSNSWIIVFIIMCIICIIVAVLSRSIQCKYDEREDHQTHP